MYVAIYAAIAAVQIHLLHTVLTTTQLLAIVAVAQRATTVYGKNFLSQMLTTTSHSPRLRSTVE
jgi:hypothetical protein